MAIKIPNIFAFSVPNYSLLIPQYLFHPKAAVWNLHSTWELYITFDEVKYKDTTDASKDEDQLLNKIGAVEWQCFP